MVAPLFQGGGLACHRGGRQVFEGVEFALARGDALVLRGPNGSGKTSLLRVLAGLLAPAAGRLAWDGEAIARDAAAHRARVHLVGHAHGLKTALTAYENLAFAAALEGGESRALGPALAAFDLEPLADAPARLLSAGQRRRLALARLVCAPRPLWLLDEPGVGLDAASRHRFEALVGRHRAEGGIAVLATHGDITVEDPLVLDLG